MAMTVCAAIIGLGSWGQTRVGSTQGQIENLKFTSAFTRTPSKVAAFCSQHGIVLASSYEAVLADDEVDAVVLTTPHSQHEAQIEAAARGIGSLARLRGRVDGLHSAIRLASAEAGRPRGAHDAGWCDRHDGAAHAEVAQNAKPVTTPVVVLNQPGGGQTVATAYLDQRPGDGHAVLVSAS